MSTFEKRRQMSEADVQLLRRAGDPDKRISLPAQDMIAKALELPLRKGILSGNILGGLFEPMRFVAGEEIKMPLHFLAPGTERDYIAYAIPNQGLIPYRHVEGDYLIIPTYTIGHGIDCLLDYLRDARWDVAADIARVLEAGFVKKMNDDGWHVVLGAGVDRNILVYDNDAAAGQFTKRLVSLMKTVMMRNGGGNSTSLDGFNLTDLFLSPEAMEDIRNWNVDQIDEVTRREIFTAGDGVMSRIYGVNLQVLREFGVGQEYQLFFSNELGASMGASDEEIVVGVDMSRDRGLVMPIREEVRIFADDNLLRERKAGWFGWSSQGFACLDSRLVLLGSF